ncbi:hypothetical protein [Cytobacillus gottheilii]|uniref:hypothetical protein n=1 Tax=Cytobacillus gottheilii TaxID=859144 RepID=UPI0009B96276|nr:hypothetical protein [Cytobacillus gottheilii]
MNTKERKVNTWIIYSIITFVTVGVLYYTHIYKPKNSIELYQELTFADSYEEIQKLMLDGYEDNFSEEDFEYIQNRTAKRVGQFSLFEYHNKSYVIMTSPGTEKLKVLAVEELPEDMREFFEGIGN